MHPNVQHAIMRLKRRIAITCEYVDPKKHTNLQRIADTLVATVLAQEFPIEVHRKQVARIVAKYFASKVPGSFWDSLVTTAARNMS